MMPPSMNPSLGTPPFSSYRPPHTYNPLPPVQSTPLAPPTPVLSPSLTPVSSPPTQPVPSGYSQPVPSQPAPPAQENITHWFYQNPSPDSEADNWLPFSNIDSKKLESAFDNGSVDPIEVAGGRYIADLVNGFRTPVYWTEDYEAEFEMSRIFTKVKDIFFDLEESIQDYESFI